MPKHSFSTRSALPLVLLGLLLAGCSRTSTTASTRTPTPTAITSAPTPTLTPAPSPTTTPVPGSVSVSDTTIAGQLSFAFVQANDVWVSWQGAAPHQITHLGLDTTNLSWSLIWSDDHSKLLTAENNNFSGGVFQAIAWVIALPGGAITPLQATPDIASSFQAWLGNRYLVYMDPARVGSHAQYRLLYDTQAQRPISTALDNQLMTLWDIHGTSLYFSPYIDSTGRGGPFVPGEIRRFDLASNQVSTVFTVNAGALVSGGLSSANWDTSADGSKIVYYFFGGALRDCPAGIHCKTIYQDTTGRTTAIFPSFQANDPTAPQISIPLWMAPNGKEAAAFLTGGGLSATSLPSDTLVQQALPAGNIWINNIPTGTVPYDEGALGWLSQPAGVIITQFQLDTYRNTRAISIFFAPAGSNDAAHLVETIQLGRVTFAPLG